jgi:hypothetical protein
MTDLADELTTCPRTPAWGSIVGSSLGRSLTQASSSDRSVRKPIPCGKLNIVLEDGQQCRVPFASSDVTRES